MIAIPALRSCRRPGGKVHRAVRGARPDRVPLRKLLRMSHRLASYLQGFLAAAGLDRPQAVRPDFDGALGRLDPRMPLRLQSLYDWPEPDKAALQALLTDWTVVLEYAGAAADPELTARHFLAETSSSRLGANVVAELIRQAPDLRRMYRFRCEGAPDPV